MDYQEQDREERQDKGGAASDFGNRVFSMIQDSVESMDFKNLSDNIEKALDGAREEALRQMNQVRERQSGRETGYGGKTTPVFINAGRGRKLVPGRLKKNPGLYSGPVEIGIGGAGVAFFGGMGIVFSLSALAGTAVSAVSLIFALPTAICAGVLGKGIWDSRRARRIRKYAGEWMGKSYIMIEDLAGKCGIGERRILKDIRFLTERRLLPGAALDREETCLMLTDEARKQYEEAVSQRELRQAEEARERQAEEEMSRAPVEEREIYRIKKEGRQYLKQIADLKKEIDSERVRTSLTRMETLSARIFVCASEHPESISQTDKLFRYYFPSVVKLVQVYEEMEEQPVQGENIKKTRTEIEASLDTMNQALEKLFDEMFQNVAMDVSSDIKVLEVMLRQDGLAGDGMKADSSAGLWP